MLKISRQPCSERAGELSIASCDTQSVEVEEAGEVGVVKVEEAKVVGVAER